MSVPNNIQVFGFEIFKEIEIELSKAKNVYPYSNNNDSYNAIVDLCIQLVKDLSDKKKQEINNQFWD